MMSKPTVDDNHEADRYFTAIRRIDPRQAFRIHAEKPEITIDGSAIVPSTVSTFITWFVRFATLER